MAKIKIDVPDEFPFSTTMVVRITDINYGHHLGNDALLALLHEARERFLRSHGYCEEDVEGVSLIMSDVAIVFKNQVRYGATLTIEVAAAEPGRASFDLLYRVTNKRFDEVVALAKTGMAFYDYEDFRVVRMPDGFRKVFAS